MDLQTGDRAPTDVAQVPAGQPGLPPPRADRGQAPGRLGRLGAGLSARGGPRGAPTRAHQGVAALAVLIALAAVAWHFNIRPRHDALSPVPDALRAIGATVVIFGVTGFGLVRLLLPDTLRRYELLWVLPTRACATYLRRSSRWTSWPNRYR